MKAMAENPKKHPKVSGVNAPDQKRGIKKRSEESLKSQKESDRPTAKTNMS